LRIGWSVRLQVKKDTLTQRRVINTALDILDKVLYNKHIHTNTRSKNE
jgi:hypothetical protein